MLRTYPSKWLASAKVQFLVHSIIFAHFHLGIHLELFKQNIGSSLVIVKSDWALEEKLRIF